MNAEDQTAMIGIALADEFGENNVEQDVDFEAREGTVRVSDGDVETVESVLQSHADKEAANHDIDVQFTISLDGDDVVVSGIQPQPLAEAE